MNFFIIKFNYFCENEFKNDEIICDSIEDFSELTYKKDGIFILQTNIRSMNANFNEFEVMLSKLKKKPDIIVCTESWRIQSINQFKLHGYQIYYTEGKRTRADGVIVYIRDSYDKSVEIIKLGELNVIRVELNDSYNNKYIITAISRLHCMKISSFITKLKNYLEKNKNYTKHIILGDINIDLLKFNEGIVEYISLMSDYEFLSGVNTVTRPEKGTCIDHIFCKGLDSYQNYNIHSMISDHYITALLINNVKFNNKINSILLKTDFNKLKRLAKNTKWNNIL